MKIDSQASQALKVSKDVQPKAVNFANDTPKLSLRKVEPRPIETPPLPKEAAKVPSQDFDLSMHEKSGLLQSVVSEKLTGDIIRKMPADEYLDLVYFISEIVKDSLDKKV